MKMYIIFIEKKKVKKKPNKQNKQNNFRYEISHVMYTS